MQRAKFFNSLQNIALRSAELILCERDILYWVNNWVWTFDPRLDHSYIPMELFERQGECLRWIESCEKDKNDGIFEKSRDMGATWMCCVFLVHRWLFRPGFKGAVGSRKEDLVDKADDPDCIFHKIRTIIDRLPAWMLPKGFNRNRHFKHMNITNPDNGATITGEAGDQIGRGGRNSIYFIDEAAFLERPSTVDSALSQNTNVRIYMSTPNGNGNPFAQKRRIAFNNPLGRIRLFTMHWKQDPRKNRWVMRNPDDTIFAEGIGSEALEDAEYPWYEAQKEILNDPVIIARELDINYDASIEGIVIPAHYVSAAINFENWLWSQKRLKLPARPRVGGYDVAAEGSNTNVFITRQHISVRSIKHWKLVDPIVSARNVVNLGHQERIEWLSYDADGIGISISGSLNSAGLNPRFEHYGVKNGGKCSSRRWPDSVDPKGKIRYKLSKDKFKNPRAENWWLLRERFRKTYEYKVHGIQHPLDELVSIPDHLTLITQLSSILCETAEDGKIRLETKKEMKVRGVPSPDYADSLVFCFVDKRTAKESNGKTHWYQTY